MCLLLWPMRPHGMLSVWRWDVHLSVAMCCSNLRNSSWCLLRWHVAFPFPLHGLCSCRLITSPSLWLLNGFSLWMPLLPPLTYIRGSFRGSFLAFSFGAPPCARMTVGVSGPPPIMWWGGSRPASWIWVVGVPGRLCGTSILRRASL